MNASIITFHDSSNFGAALQCVALFKTLEKNGANAQVVNYLPAYVAVKKRCIKGIKEPIHEFMKTKNLKRFVRHIIKNAAFNFQYSKTRKRNDRFSSFLQENVSLSVQYDSYLALKNNPPTVDIAIAGSDQIWNPALTGGTLDPAFFAAFYPNTVRKVAYGISIGEADPTRYTKELLALTADFDMLSVREKSAQKQLMAILHRDMQLVADPTLLLSRGEYEAMERDVSPKNAYVLLYDINNSTISESIAKMIAAQEGICIIDISPNPLHKVQGAAKRTDIGPREFLSYIHNAAYVVTNSFHGTVFSVIYQRPFISVPHIKRAGRVEGFLDSIGLTARIAHSVADAANIPKKVDYNSALPLLENLKKESIGFIQYALRGK